jgi:hypothetical protein
LEEPLFYVTTAVTASSAAAAANSLLPSILLFSLNRGKLHRTRTLASDAWKASQPATHSSRFLPLTFSLLLLLLLLPLAW